MDFKHHLSQSFREGKEAGLKEGEQNKAVETAKTMLADNLPPEKVAHYSGLSLEQVLELQKTSPVQA